MSTVPTLELAQPRVNPKLRFPNPARVERWPILWIYAIPIMLLHGLVVLAVFPYFFSWWALVLCLLGVHFFGQSITIGYHRLFAHRSFVVPRWFENVLITLAMCCMQDTPGRWVATHRYHHKYSDEVEDPHTPIVSFLWAHIGWLMVHNPRTQNIAALSKYAPDVFANPYAMRLEKWRMLSLYIYSVHALVITALGAGVGYVSSGTMEETLRMALSFLVWVVIVRTVLVWHITWSVNSLTHLMGYQTYATGEHSRNNWLVALVSVGEGWHNNHHHDAASASVQHKWWEIDLSYYEIKLLELVGIANKVIAPRHVRQGKREQAGGEQHRADTNHE